MGCLASKPAVESENPLQRTLLREQTQDFLNVYDIVEVVGQGSISVISKIRRKNSVGESSNNGTIYALKEIHLRHVKSVYMDELTNELNLLKTLDHPYIIKALETFKRKNRFGIDDRFAIVMELCTGGDLHSREPYTEAETPRIVSQMLSAVSYLHERNVIHRDIKHENVMFESEAPNASIKLIDFGLAKSYKRNDDILTERVGTLYTMSPQVLQRVYTSKADLWSIGVVTYCMLSGVRPFWGEVPKQVIHSIMKADPSYDGEEWKDISPQGKAFVQTLIELDPEKRSDAKTAIRHQWLTKNVRYSVVRRNSELVSNVRANLARYAGGGDLKKIALNVIAKKSSTDEIMDLRTIFRQFDTQRNGTISYEEFKKVLEKADFSEQEIMDIFHKVDVNHSGTVNYTEFLAATIEAQGAIEERRIADAFDLLDSDNTGFISRENLRMIVGENASQEYVDRLIGELDTDGDGLISYQEFKKAFSEENENNVRTVYQESTEESDTEQSPPMLGVDTYVPGGMEDMKKNLKTQTEEPMQVM